MVVRQKDDWITEPPKKISWDAVGLSLLSLWDVEVSEDTVSLHLWLAAASCRGGRLTLGRLKAGRSERAEGRAGDFHVCVCVLGGGGGGIMSVCVGGGYYECVCVWGGVL